MTISAYDLLRRATIKAYGKKYGKDWGLISDGTKARVREKGTAESYWGAFVAGLGDVWVGTAPELGYIAVKESKEAWQHRERFEDAILRLNDAIFHHKHWVYMELEFNETHLTGFYTKAEAITYLKKQKKENPLYLYGFYFNI